MRRRRPLAADAAGLAALAGLILVCTGCFRRVAEGPGRTGSPPVAKLAAVESAHIFAGEARDLRLGRLPPGPADLPVADPLRAWQLKAPAVLDPPDIAHIRDGLSGRAEAALKEYGSGVRQRELRSAELAARQVRDGSRNEHEGRLAGLRERLEQSVMDARVQSGAQRSRLEFEIAVLRGQAGVLPADPAGLEGQIAAKRARLSELETETGTSVARLQAQYLVDVQTANSSWEKEMDQFAARLRAAALDRAAEQERTKAALFRESVSAFISSLKQGRVVTPPALRPTGVPDSKGADRDAALARQFSQVGSRLEERIRQDALIASELARESQPRGSLALGRGAVTATAVGFLQGGQSR